MRVVGAGLSCLMAVLLAATAAAQGTPHEEVSYSCTICHQSPDDRSQITFDHDKLEFRLEGHHQVLGCKRCHDLKNFAWADDQCASCHTDYHQDRLYPECETCHSTAGWDVIDAYGAHSRTTFQLMGAHIRLDCDSCHEREIIAERAQLYWDCYDCHDADYESVVFPSHTNPGFDTRCETCHMQVAWQPTIMNEHPGGFPIFSGAHAGEWGSCSDCHVNPDDFWDFSCVECHEHNQTDMDAEHAEVPFYFYSADGCYYCHENGTAEGD